MVIQYYQKNGTESTLQKYIGFNFINSGLFFSFIILFACSIHFKIPGAGAKTG